MKPSRTRPKTRFERNASQVVFDPVKNEFVVTWSKCGLPKEERLKVRAPQSWIPSISAVATLYERGGVAPDEMCAAASAAERAWKDGDRLGLDTDGAKKAAEMVGSLAAICADPMDIGHAMRMLLDEMAKARFAGMDPEDFDEALVMPAIDRCVDGCLEKDGFSGWPETCRRRCFLFGLKRKERTSLAYTLVSLLFDCGSCPLLSLMDRAALRIKAMAHSGLSEAFTRETVSSFVRFSLGRMRDARERGLSSIGEKLTQQQIVCSLPECDNTKTKDRREGMER